MKNIIACLCLCISFGFLQAQQSSPNGKDDISLTTIIPPAPTVASLMHFEEVSVDLYSGQPSIGIPLGQVPISDKLTYSIGIQYNTQAVRIDERSGWLGTGFSMATGGVISRTVRGIPDENNSQLLGRGVLHTNFKDFDGLTLAQQEEFLWKTANGLDQYDTQYDLYQYNFFGKSGRFIVQNIQGQLTPVIIGSDTNDIIKIYHNTALEITQFQVIDTNGYIYTFEETSSNVIYNNTVTTSQFGNSSTASTTLGTGAVNAWYLKDVRLPNDTVLCSFSYQSIQENYNTPVSRTTNQLLGNPSFGSSDVSNINKGMLLPKEVSSSQQIFSTQKYVDEVTMRDGSKIKYHLSLGHPEYGGHTVTTGNSGGKLNYIEIFQPNGDLHKKIDFSYTTSTNNRLFLTGVSEVFGGETLDYVLAYENLDELPSFGSDAKDAWGYYNGDYNDPVNNNQLITKSGSVNPSKITTGTLSSITYPLGGKKEFTFQSNDFSYEGASDYDYSKIPDNRQIYNRFGSLYVQLDQQTSNNKLLVYFDRGQRIQINKSNLITQSCADISKHNVSLSLVMPKAGVNVTPPSNGNYFGAQLSDFEYASNNFSYSFNVENGMDFPVVSPGWYFVELTTPQVEISPCDYTDTGVELTIDLKYTEYNLITKVQKGGGLRIKEVAFTDNGVERQKTTYNYKDNHLIEDFTVASIDDYISSGSYEANLNKRTYIKGKQHPFVIGVNCWELDRTIYRTPELVEYQVSRDINAVLTPTTKGNYVGYKKVYVKKEENGGTLYTFISPRDVEILTTDNTDYPFLPVENKDYKRGVVEKKEVFDESERLLIEETYTYTDVSSIAEHSNVMFELRDRDCPWDQFYNSFFNYSQGNIENHGEFCGPGVEANVVTCHSSNPDPNAGVGIDIRAVGFDYIKGILLQNEVIKKDYFYDDQNTVSFTTTTSKSVYNFKNRLKEKITEFAEGGVNTIIKEEIRYPYDYETSEYTTAEQTDLTKMVSLNQIEAPVQNKQYKDGVLIYDTQRIFKEFYPNVIKVAEVKSAKANTIKQSRVQFHSYTSLGQPLEVSQTDGTRISYVWGYNSMYPIAKLENASYASLTNDQTSALANVYIASNADVDVTTEDALVQALNELRAKFPNAMVTTLTYDPLKGVTRMSDPRGYTSYFEYDVMHRLEKVKDADKNILSTNQYVYSNGNSSLLNYVKSTMFQTPTQDGANVSDWDKIETINYADGLGRAQQTIGIRQGGNGEDIVTPFDYDDLGRQTKEFLPYATTSLNGGYHVNMFNDQVAFYNTLKYENTTNPYSEKSLEKSPLSRVLEQGAPGLAWQLDTIADTDHTIKMEYHTNSHNGVFADTNYDNVLRFSVSYGSNEFTDVTLNQDGYYLSGELYKSIVKDENWQPNQTYEKDHTKEEFADKLGRIILKRTYNENERHDTYYVYDDYGNLTHVVPPLADLSDGISTDELSNLCYQYAYDHRNRLIEKQLPAKKREYIVYDTLDRPVLTQDANLGAEDKWLFTKYDVLGRVAYTGIVINSEDRAALQSQMDGVNTYEIPTAVATSIGDTSLFYTNNNYPNDSSVVVLTANYYDDYRWDTENSLEANYDISHTGLTPNSDELIWEKQTATSWSNAGFITDGVIHDDGYVEYTLGISDKRMMIGLSHQATASQTNHNSINYRIYTGYNSNRVYVYNEATLESIPLTYAEQGDTMRLERYGNQILFKKNGETFHVITTSYTGTLVGSGCMIDNGAIIENIHVGYSVYGQSFTANTKGLPTGSKVRTIGTNDWTTSESYYDDKAQPIHVASKNTYLDTRDVISNRVDFTGKVVESRTTHVRSSDSPIVTVDAYVYDENARLLYQTKQINGGKKELISRSHYDALGQLEKKQVGGALPSISSYTNMQNVAVSGYTITKTGTNNAWDGSLTTDTSISGDGYLSFQIPQDNKAVIVGLAENSGDSNYTSIDYAIYMTSWGAVRIYESGVNLGDKTTYFTGDTFKIERRGTKIYYLKNEEIFHISDGSSTINPLIGDISLYSTDAKIEDLVLVDLEKELQEVDFTYNVRGWLKGINDINNQGNDLFSFAITYNDITDPTKQLFNGNISSTLWRTKGQDSDPKNYLHEYDALNRITSAVDNTANYNLNSVKYDRNGNIKELIRKGHTNTSATTFDIMDNLSYSYAGNQLLNVTDASTISFGFNDGNVHTSTNPSDLNNDYTYDDNGNMIKDKNKGISNISYNYLNLPTQITFDNGSTISYIYDASGTKLEKEVNDVMFAGATYTYYAGNYIYKKGNSQGQQNVTLTFFNTEEGYVEPQYNPAKPGKISSFSYTYQYKDHLGNIRLSYEDLNDDGSIDPLTEIKEENHYYPFGLLHKGYNNQITGRDHNYGYNGIEESNELGNNMLEMDLRQYDPAIARWVVIDPITHHDYSPYQAFDNNPVFWNDPTGADAESFADGNIMYFDQEDAIWAFNLAIEIWTSENSDKNDNETAKTDENRGIGARPLSKKELGLLLETSNNTRIEHRFQELFQEWGRKNYWTFKVPTIPYDSEDFFGVLPDGVSSGMTLFGRTVVAPNVAFWDAKATSKSVLGTNFAKNRQFRGYIDVLSKLNVKNTTKNVLIYVTTSNVVNINALKEYAEKKGVAIRHIVAYSEWGLFGRGLFFKERVWTGVPEGGGKPYQDIDFNNQDRVIIHD
jgi:RHS repeat-associated protein